MNTSRANRRRDYELISIEVDHYMCDENIRCLLQRCDIKGKTTMVQSRTLNQDYDYDDSKKVSKLNLYESPHVPVSTIHAMLTLNDAVNIVEGLNL